MLGVYIHIPFCQSRCRYCDFFSTTQLESRNAYVDAVIKEWQARANEVEGDIRTLYIGGGTPSMLDVADIQRLVAAIATPETVEITMEANPGDLTLDKLQALRAAGINRLSIGIQTFRNPLLRRIGRRHTARQARLAVKWAQQAGFNNISIDLMFGLPRQNLIQWEMDVRAALRLGVQHISCYCLSYEQGTPLTKMVERGEITPTSERLQNRMYNFLCKVTKRQGWDHYEVSNFALPGYRSQHNSSYWNHTPYIGLGAGAHSFDGKVRSWNPNDLKAYMTGIQTNTLQRESETLTQEQRHIEQVMLQLRTVEGIDEALVSNRMDKVNDYVHRGLLRRKKNKLIATQEGLNILNRIIEDLI